LNKNGSGEITYKVKINEIPNSEVKIKNKFEVKDEKLINPKMHYQPLKAWPGRKAWKHNS